MVDALSTQARANPDMQRRFGYEPDPPLKGNPAICSNQIGLRFDCLSATLEMPFKDTAHNPRRPGEVRGFDGRRCAALGCACMKR